MAPRKIIAVRQNGTYRETRDAAAIRLQNTYGNIIRRAMDLQMDIDSDDDFFNEYDNSKRQWLSQEVDKLYKAVGGILVNTELLVWHTRSELEGHKFIPGNCRFPINIKADTLVVGSWVTLNGTPMMVVSIRFDFRRGIQSVRRLPFIILICHGPMNKPIEITTHASRLRALSFKQRLDKTKSVLTRFFRIVLEHCRYKPGSKLSGYYDVVKKRGEAAFERMKNQ